MEIEGLPIEGRPQGYVNKDSTERGGPRGPGAGDRQEGLQRFSHEVPRSGLPRIETGAARLIELSAYQILGLRPVSLLSGPLRSFLNPSGSG